MAVPRGPKDVKKSSGQRRVKPRPEHPQIPKTVLKKTVEGAQPLFGPKAVFCTYPKDSRCPAISCPFWAYMLMFDDALCKVEKPSKAV